MGAVIRSDEFKHKYVSSKVKNWIDDLRQLAEIAVEEPQAALSAYTKCISHRWTYIQRTIPKIKHLFIPLEDCIRNSLIPSLIGRQVSDIERKILSLPVRFGGLGIADPSETADREYNASKRVTVNLTNLILQQQQDISLYDSEATAAIVKHINK